jgi:hypothetical protein
MATEPWEHYMSRIISKLLIRRDIGAFRDEFDWEAAGLTDYLQVIKYPMDLSFVNTKLESGMYSSREECVQDIRMIWENAKTYFEVIK